MDEKPLVLVVEDSARILDIITHTLESAEFRVRKARTALEGVREAREESPDLILADVMLPDQDGAVAMSCLKEHPEFQDVPLILVSALPEEELSQKKKEVGAVDVIHKPFGRADLIARVHHWLSVTHPKPSPGGDAGEAKKEPSPMRACASCGSLYEMQKPVCPKCAQVVGSFLAKSLTSPEDARQLTLRMLRKLESKWNLSFFASGWKLLDLALRFVIALFLISLAFSTSIILQDADSRARAGLAEYRKVSQEAGASRKKPTAEQMDLLLLNYDRLLDSAGDLVDGQTRDSWLHVWVLLGILALVLTTGISGYRGYKEYNQLKAAMAFILTSEGRAFAEQLQRQRLEDETKMPAGVARKAGG